MYTFFQGREPFVSHEGLEQLNRFLFVLGITHVLYSCVAVGLAMSKVCIQASLQLLTSTSVIEIAICFAYLKNCIHKYP